MFVFTEAGYQLLRNRGRSILLLCVSALLCGCMAFYLGNIATSQRDLDTLNESSPAVLHLVNAQGRSRRDLTISSLRYDVLTGSEIHDVLATSQASAQYGGSGRDEGFSGGDTSLLGITCKEAAGFISESQFTFGAGYDCGIFTGSDALCVVTEEFAGAHGLSIGDSLTLPVYLVPYDMYRRPVYVWVADLTMEIAGTVEKTSDVDFRADIYVPIAWLRAQAEEANVSDFNYSTFEAKLNDSMALNDYKAFLDSSGFYHPVDQVNKLEFPDLSVGEAVLMEDETFIKTAERLVDKLEQFETFLVPFFAVIILLTAMAIFLVLRGSRKDIAIANSLGRPKLLGGSAAILSAIAAELLGCLIALPAMVLLAGLSIGLALMICGAFLLCALLGDVGAMLLLLRFDPLQMLLESE